MYNTTENTQVDLSLFTHSSNKINRFKAGKAVDKISPVKTFPRFNV